MSIQHDERLVQVVRTHATLILGIFNSWSALYLAAGRGKSIVAVVHIGSGRLHYYHLRNDSDFDEVFRIEKGAVSYHAVITSYMP